MASLKKDQIVGKHGQTQFTGETSDEKITEFVLLKNLRLEFRGDQTTLSHQIWI